MYRDGKHATHAAIDFLTNILTVPYANVGTVVRGSYSRVSLPDAESIWKFIQADNA